MKVFAISDLHLSFQTDKQSLGIKDNLDNCALSASLEQSTRHKPMDLFGEQWVNYEQRIMDDWNAKVGAEDIGIIAGDISWAMKMEDSVADFDYISKLRGTKIIIRGNHDYWWKSISKIRETLPKDIIALQNDSIKIGSIVFCGTRGWRVPERRAKQDGEDKKIFDREVIRFELSLQDAKKKMTEGDKLVAIVHYPPFNCMRDDSPFTTLCEKYGVSACIYGHLHGKNCRDELFTVKNGVKYYLTSCDLLKHQVAEIKL